MEAPCRVGCCGWSGAQARYFSDFPVIELQTPFYEPPSPALAVKWRAAAPSQFEFCLKAWQLITHTPASPTYRRLKSKLSPDEQGLVGSFRPTEQVWLAWERTRQVADLLRAAVIVFQCPASFTPEREHVRNLDAFFSRIQHRSSRLAWEPRGNWPLTLVKEICAAHNLIHCVDPFAHEPVYGDLLYWRLHGRTGYGYRYTDEDLNELEGKLRQHQPATAGPAYLLFNNVQMRQDAQRFLQRASVGTIG